MSGKGAIACTSPLNAGLFGRYDRIANDLIEASDCLLVVGCKLGEIATKRFTVPVVGKTLIHMDIVAEEMGRAYAPTLKLWGDAKAGLEDLHAGLVPGAAVARASRDGYLKEVAEKMATWRDSVADRLNSDETPVNMARLIKEVNDRLPDNGYLVADGGFAAHWGGLLFDTRKAARNLCRTEVSHLSATACRAPWACSWPRLTLQWSASRGMVDSTWCWVSWRRLGMGLGITMIVVGRVRVRQGSATPHVRRRALSSDLSEPTTPKSLRP